MRRNLLTLLTFFLTFIGHSQNSIFSKLYVKAYGGYGFLSPGSYRVQSNAYVNYLDLASGLYKSKSVNSEGNRGIGLGWRFGGGLGYLLNDFLNVGIDFEYQKGIKVTNHLGTRQDLYQYDSTSDELHYKALTLTPYITFKALAKPKFFIYNKLGIQISLPFELYTSGNSFKGANGYGPWPPGPSDSAYSSISNHIITREGSYKISLGVGFNVAFGVNFRLSNKLRVFTEMFGNFAALEPITSKLTTIDETHYFSYVGNYDYSTSPATFINFIPDEFIRTDGSITTYKYHKKGPRHFGQGSFSAGPGPDFINYYIQPIEDQGFTVNMNSMGLNVGIIYRF